MFWLMDVLVGWMFERSGCFGWMFWLDGLVDGCSREVDVLVGWMFERNGWMDVREKWMGWLMDVREKWMFWLDVLVGWMDVLVGWLDVLVDGCFGWMFERNGWMFERNDRGFTDTLISTYTQKPNPNSHPYTLITTVIANPEMSGINGK